MRETAEFWVAVLQAYEPTTFVIVMVTLVAIAVFGVVLSDIEKARRRQGAERHGYADPAAPRQRMDVAQSVPRVARQRARVSPRNDGQRPVVPALSLVRRDDARHRDDEHAAPVHIRVAASQPSDSGYGETTCLVAGAQAQRVSAPGA